MARILISVVCFLFAISSNAQTMDQEIAALGGRLSKTLSEKHFKSIAAVDFQDLQGTPTELGRFLAEQLTVEMVSVGSISMVTRAHIQSILAEHQLTVDGLVKPENAKKLGEFAGVDVLLNGVITALDDRIILTVQAVSTDSAKVVAAGRVSFAKTSEVIQLLNRSVASASARLGNVAESPARQLQRVTDAGVISSKDFGTLRVNLKSVIPIRFRDRRGDFYNGIRCTFDFINLETQRSIHVAGVAEAGNDGKMRVGGASNVGTALGEVMRVSLTDDRGVAWRTYAPYVRGMGILSPGWNENLQPFTPTNIPALLGRAEATGSNLFKDHWGDSYPFIWGVMTPIAPGQSATVTLEFVQDPPNNTTSPYPGFVQFSGEIVTGIPSRNSKLAYSILNLVYDRVDLPKK